MILPKPLGSRPIYKNQADFFRKAANRKNLKCPGSGMWTSIPGNKSLYGPPHGTREPPRGTVRGDGAPCSRHIHLPLQATFTQCSHSVHAWITCHSHAEHVPPMPCSHAIHVLTVCRPCRVHMPITCHSHAIHTWITYHSRGVHVPFSC